MKCLFLFLSCLNCFAQFPYSGTTWTSPSASSSPLSSMVEGWHFDTLQGTSVTTAIIDPLNNLSRDNNQTFYETNGVATGSSNALYFASLNHTGDLSLADNATVGAGAGVSFTYTVWLYFPSVTLANNPVVCKWSTTGNTVQDYILYWAANNFYFQVNNVANNAEPFIQISPTPTALAYHFIAFGYDDSIQKIFTSIDGGTMQTTAVVGVHESSVGLHIGNYSTAGSAGSPIMKIDELYLWHRALSQSEITAQAAGTPGTFYQGGH